jgi:tetratricopeptide (TPR) repeat protein
MRLSVCLITKNEEENLERVIRSFESVADEIIVTDTGSTDDTVKLAKELGAKVSHFPWCDDFAAARNFCFKQAQGDWIFWIDADEELLAESVDEVSRCISRDEVFAYFILRQDLTDLSRPELYTEMLLDRLFRNHEHLHHVGRCHSQFKPSLIELAEQEGKVVETSQIRIRHWGFAGPRRAEKYQRDIKLLELELQDRPGRLYYQVELYRTLLLVGDERWRSVLSEATVNLSQYVDDANPPTPQAALLLETLLQLPRKELPAGVSKNKVQELAGRWFGRSGPLLWLLAKQDYEKGRFEKAESRLRQLIEMGRQHSYDRSVGFDPKIFGDEAKLNLGVCLVRQAKLDEAAEILESLVSNNSLGVAAKQNLDAIEKIRRCRPRRIQRKRNRK